MASGLRAPIPIPLLTERDHARFWSHVDASERNHAKCWPWTGGLTRQGYARFSIGRIWYRASRVALTIVHGPLPEPLLDVLHRCDNPACVRPSHLFTGTHLENIHDMVAKGRYGRRNLSGEENPRSVLTEADVRHILATFTGKRGQLAAFARTYGVTSTTIEGVVRNRTWRHIDRPDAGPTP